MTEKTSVIVTTVVPVAALAMYLILGAKPVYAADLCYYGGVSYSHGAQISNACSGATTQTCDNGTWTSCA